MGEERDGILFLDDIEMVLALVAKYANSWGFRAYTCQTEQEAEAILQDNPNIKLVFVDFHLGKDQEHGLNVIKHLKRFQEHRPLKFCLFTGIRNSLVEQNYRSYGAEGFLEKPINPTKFKTMILNLLGSAADGEMSMDHRIKINNYPCSLIDSNIRPVFYLKELTSNTIVLESSADIAEDTVIKIHCPSIGRLLDITPYFSLKIQKSRSYKQIEKDKGEDWAEGFDHLLGHYKENFLLRGLVLDMSQKAQSAIQAYYKNLSESARKKKQV